MNSLELLEMGFNSVVGKTMPMAKSRMQIHTTTTLENGLINKCNVKNTCTLVVHKDATIMDVNQDKKVTIMEIDHDKKTISAGSVGSVGSVGMVMVMVMVMMMILILLSMIEKDLAYSIGVEALSIDKEAEKAEKAEKAKETKEVKHIKPLKQEKEEMLKKFNMFNSLYECVNEKKHTYKWEG